MIVLGLTGSIGMGKSATAKMFLENHIPVHDADACVHQLMAPGGQAFDPISLLFRDVIKDGVIDRQALGAIVFKDPSQLQKLEAILHPLVRAHEVRFLRQARLKKSPLAVLDIPLLFETGGEKRCDAVCVVSTLASIQRRRVMRRAAMTPDKFSAILKKQMPDLQKRLRADHVIFTGAGFRSARIQVKKIIKIYTSLKQGQ